MQAHVGPVIAERDALTVIDCRTCGWAHLEPLPAVDDAYYRDTFWSEKGAGWLARYEAERDWLDMRNGDWLSVVEEHTDGRTLLDVGCGYGFFISEADKRGWFACGIEPSKEAADYANRAMPDRVFHGPWENNDARISIDCISALWLMEHLPNPFEFLGWAQAHLAPGGVLLLCVPNDFNTNQAIANDKVKVPFWWVHPTHLNYWTWAMFANMLGRAGFRIVDRLATDPIDGFLVAGVDYTANEKMGDAVFHAAQQSELSKTRPERIREARELGLLGQGRDQVVVCK